MLAHGSDQQGHARARQRKQKQGMELNGIEVLGQGSLSLNSEL